jgi:hypothetical protein
MATFPRSRCSGRQQRRLCRMTGAARRAHNCTCTTNKRHRAVGGRGQPNLSLSRARFASILRLSQLTMHGSGLSGG